MFGDYSAFIFASYGVAFGTIALLVLWVVLDGKLQQKTIDQLQADAMKRRASQNG